MIGSSDFNHFSARMNMVHNIEHYFTKFRSSHQRCSVRKGVLRNFTKFTGKHLRQSLFFNKVASLRPAILLKKRLCHRCFLKFLRTSFIMEHLWWLLLEIMITLWYEYFEKFCMTLSKFNLRRLNLLSFCSM